MEDVRTVPRMESLRVRGFRGFRDEVELRLAQPTGSVGSGLTIVVGANNVGKSTLWESFDALARRFNPGRWSPSEISFSEGKRNRGVSGGIRISASYGDGIECVIESLGIETSETTGTIFADGGQDAVVPSLVVVPSRRQFRAKFGQGGEASKTWMTRSGEYSRHETRDGFSARLFELHADREKKAAFDALLAEVIGTPLPWSIDLSDGNSGDSYYLKIAAEKGLHYTSEGLGDGVISLLFVLNALYDADSGTVVVIDEPELSLHPELVRRLGDVIARFAARIQIVIFTHAPALISWDSLANGAEIARVYKRGHVSMIAQAARSVVEDISALRRSWRTPHSIGSDAKEALFLEDRLVVVEGQEDAALLPRVAQLVSGGLGGTVYGWGAGGDSNIEKVLALLQTLGFQRVAAIFDNNVPTRAERVRRLFPEYLVTMIPAPDIRTKPRSDEKPEVVGLLDKHGREFSHPSLAEPTRAVFAKVAEFLTLTD